MKRFFNKLGRLAMSDTAYFVTRKIFISFGAILLTLVGIVLYSPNAYAYSNDDYSYLLGTDGTIVSGSSTLANNTTVDGWLTTEIVQHKPNGNYYYSNDGKIYKMLYYVWQETKGEEVDDTTAGGKAVAVYAPLSSLNINTTIDNTRYYETDTSYNFYNIYSFVPKWIGTGDTTYISTNTYDSDTEKYNSLYQQIAGGEIKNSGEIDAYYKYDQINQDAYYSTSEVQTINIIYQYNDGSTYSFDNININDYYNFYIDIVNAKELSYKLQVEGPTKRKYFVTETGERITVDSESWSSDYETSYYVNNENTIHVWDSENRYYISYVLTDLANLGYINQSEIKTLKNKASEETVISLNSNNDIVAKVKRYQSLIETSYQIVQTKTESETVYVTSLNELQDSNSINGNSVTSIVYSDIAKTPNAFDVTYTYYFDYYNSQIQYLYETTYTQQLYNYKTVETNYLDSYKDTYSIAETTGQSGIYSNNIGSLILLNDEETYNASKVYYTVKNYYDTYKSADGVQDTTVNTTLMDQVSSQTDATYYSSNNVGAEKKLVTAQDSSNKTDWQTLYLYNGTTKLGYKDVSSTLFGNTTYTINETKYTSALAKAQESTYADYVAFGNKYGTGDDVTLTPAQINSAVASSIGSQKSASVDIKRHATITTTKTGNKMTAYSKDGITFYSDPACSTKLSDSTYVASDNFASVAQHGGENNKVQRYSKPEAGRGVFQHCIYKYTYLKYFKIDIGGSYRYMAVPLCDNTQTSDISGKINLQMSANALGQEDANYIYRTLNNSGTGLSSSYLWIQQKGDDFLVKMKGYPVESLSFGHDYNALDDFADSYVRGHLRSTTMETITLATYHREKYSDWGRTRYNFRSSYDPYVVQVDTWNNPNRVGNKGVVKYTYDQIEREELYDANYNGTSDTTLTTNVTSATKSKAVYYLQKHEGTYYARQYTLTEYNIYYTYTADKVTVTKGSEISNNYLRYHYDGNYYTLSKDGKKLESSSIPAGYVKGTSGAYYNGEASCSIFVGSETAGASKTFYRYSNLMQIKENQPYTIIPIVKHLGVSGSIIENSIDGIVDSLKTKIKNSTVAKKCIDENLQVYQVTVTVSMGGSNAPATNTVTLMRKLDINKYAWSTPVATSIKEEVTNPIHDVEYFPNKATSRVSATNPTYTIVHDKTADKNKFTVDSNKDTYAGTGINRTWTRTRVYAWRDLHEEFLYMSNGNSITLYNISTNNNVTSAETFLSNGTYQGSTGTVTNVGNSNFNFTTTGSSNLTKYQNNSTGIVYKVTTQPKKVDTGTYIGTSTEIANKTYPTYTKPETIPVPVKYQKINTTADLSSDTSSNYYYMNSSDATLKNIRENSLCGINGNTTNCYAYTHAVQSNIDYFYSATKNTTTFTNTSATSNIAYGTNSGNLTNNVDTVEYGEYRNITVDLDGQITSGTYVTTTNAKFETASKNLFNQTKWFTELKVTGLLKQMSGSNFVLKNTTNSSVTLNLNNYFDGTLTANTYYLTYTLNGNRVNGGLIGTTASITIPANTTYTISQIVINKTQNSAYTPYVSLKAGNSVQTEMYLPGTTATCVKNYVDLADNVTDTNYDSYSNLFNALNIKTEITGYQGENSVTDTNSLLLYANNNTIDANKILYSLTYQNGNKIVTLANNLTFKDLSSTYNNLEGKFRFIHNGTKIGLNYQKTRDYTSSVVSTTQFSALNDNKIDDITSNSTALDNENGAYSEYMKDYMGNYYHISTAMGKKLALENYANSHADQTAGTFTYYYDGNTFYRINNKTLYYKFNISTDVNKSETVKIDNMHQKLDIGYTNIVVEYSNDSYVEGSTSITSADYNEILEALGIEAYKTAYVSKLNETSVDQYKYENGNIYVNDELYTGSKYAFLMTEEAYDNTKVATYNNGSYKLFIDTNGQTFKEFKLHYMDGIFKQQVLEITDPTSDNSVNANTSADFTTIHDVNGESETLDLFGRNGYYYVETDGKLFVGSNGYLTNSATQNSLTIKEVSDFVTNSQLKNNIYTFSNGGSARIYEALIIQDTTDRYKLYNDAGKSVTVTDADDVQVLDLTQYNSTNEVTSSGTYRLRWNGNDPLYDDFYGYYPNQTYTYELQNTNVDAELNQYLWSNGKLFEIQSISRGETQYNILEDLEELQIYMLMWTEKWQLNENYQQYGLSNISFKKYFDYINPVSITSQFSGQMVQTQNGDAVISRQSSYEYTDIVGTINHGRVGTIDRNYRRVLKYISKEVNNYGRGSEDYSLTNYNATTLMSNDLASLANYKTLELGNYYYNLCRKLIYKRYGITTNYIVKGNKPFETMFTTDPDKLHLFEDENNIPILPEDNYFSYLVERDENKITEQSMFEWYGEISGYASVPLIDMQRFSDIFNLAISYVPHDKDNPVSYGNSYAILNYGNERLIYREVKFDKNVNNIASQVVQKYIRTDDGFAFNNEQAYSLADAFNNVQRKFYKYDITSQLAGTSQNREAIYKMTGYYYATWVNSPEFMHTYNFINTSGSTYGQRNFYRFVNQEDITFISDGTNTLQSSQYYYHNIGITKNFYDTKQDYFNYAWQHAHVGFGGEQAVPINNYENANQITDFYVSNIINNIGSSSTSTKESINSEYVDKMYYYNPDTKKYENITIDSFYNELDENVGVYVGDTRYNNISEMYKAGLLYVQKEVEGSDSVADFIYDTMPSTNAYYYSAKPLQYLEITMGSTTNHLGGGGVNVSGDKTYHFVKMIIDGTTHYYMPNIRDGKNTVNFKETWNDPNLIFHAEVNSSSIEIDPFDEWATTFWFKLTHGGIVYVFDNSGDNFSFNGNGWIDVNTSSHTNKVAPNRIRVTLQRKGYYKLNYALTSISNNADENGIIEVQDLTMEEYNGLSLGFYSGHYEYYVETTDSGGLLPISSYGMLKNMTYTKGDNTEKNSFTSVADFVNKISNLGGLENFSQIHLYYNSGSGEIDLGTVTALFRSRMKLTEVDISEEEFYNKYILKDKGTPVTIEGISTNLGLQTLIDSSGNPQVDTDYASGSTSFSFTLQFKQPTAFIYQLSYESATDTCSAGFIENKENGKTMCYYNGIDKEKFVTTNSILKSITLATNINAVYYNLAFNFNQDVLKISNLVGSANYELKIFNILGQLQQTVNFETGEDLVYNPYGTFFQDEANQNHLSTDIAFNDQLLKSTYISATMNQCLFSDGSAKYCTEANGTTYKFSDNLILRGEQSINTISKIVLKFHSDKGETYNEFIRNAKVKFTNNETNAVQSYTINSYGELHIEVTKEMRKVLKTYMEMFPDETNSMQITDSALRNFIQSEIIKKYTISFEKMPSGVRKSEVLKIIANVEYKTDVMYLDLNQNGLFDTSLDDYDYRDYKGNPIISEESVAYEPLASVGAFTCEREFTFKRPTLSFAQWLDIQMPKDTTSTDNTYSLDFMLLYVSNSKAYKYVVFAYTKDGRPIIVG